MRRLWLAGGILAVAVTALALRPADPPPLRFVLLGDRTGETQPGVWQQVWKDIAADDPAFVVGAGDSIQGGNDESAESEWREVERGLAPSAKIPLYLAPGNHDIWSPLSERLFTKYTHHPLHYSFDRGPLHFTVLDDSRSDALPHDEFAFLEADLREHPAQPFKFVVSHRPSWILDAALRNTNAQLHVLAKKYGVQYMVAGHVHQIIHTDLDGVTYLCLPSAGGHLRASEKYEDGWFFGYIVATIEGKSIRMQVKELGPPHGKGRTNDVSDWGLTGLAVRR